MSFDDNSSVVPLFIKKLKLLVDDDVMDEYIAWDASGESFHIFDANRLAKEVLPLYFKHNNISSFIRQLNMYGFRKLNRTDSGGVLRLESDEMEFYHAYFKRNRDDLLIRIQRKPKTFSPIYNGVGDARPPRYNSTLQLNSSENDRAVSRSEFCQLVEMVKHIKNKQDNSDQRVEVLKLENEQLLRDLNDLKTKHENQANVVQTLFSFLTSYATDNRSYLAAKRKLALPNSTFDSTDKGTNSRAVVVLNNPPKQDMEGVEQTTPPRIILQSKKVARLSTGGPPTSQLHVKQQNGPNKTVNLKQVGVSSFEDELYQDSPDSQDRKVLIEEVIGESASGHCTNNSILPVSSHDRFIIRVSSQNTNHTTSIAHSLVKQEPTEEIYTTSIGSAFTPFKKVILHPSIKGGISDSSLRLKRTDLENFGYHLSEGEANETETFLNSALFNHSEKRTNPNIITESVTHSSDTDSPRTDSLSPLSDGQEIIPVNSINRGLDLPISSSMSSVRLSPTIRSVCDFDKFSSSFEHAPVVDTIWHHPDIGLPSPSMELNLLDNGADSPVSNDDFIDSLLCSSDSNTNSSSQPQFSSVEPQSPLALANLSRVQKSSRSS